VAIVNAPDVATSVASSVRPSFQRPISTLTTWNPTRLIASRVISLSEG